MRILFFFRYVRTLIFVRLASLGERSAETLVETRCDTGLGWHQSKFVNSSNSVFISYHSRPVSLALRSPRLAKRTKIKIRTVRDGIKLFLLIVPIVFSYRTSRGQCRWRSARSAETLVETAKRTKIKIGTVFKNS